MSPAGVIGGAGAALVVAVVAVFGSTPAAAHDSTPEGAQYCGQVSRDESVSLEVFARGVSCSYSRAYARRCLTSSSLHGWRFHGQQGFTGRFRLTRGNGTLWLDDAGGGARCLTR